MPSPSPTAWAVICPVHGKVYLTYHEYLAQLQRPDDRWMCSACGLVAGWDDANYDAWSDAHAPTDPEC